MKDELVPADYTSMDMLKAQEFDRKVKQNFGDVFPSVVRQIIETCGAQRGICVDIGSGTAMLSIELVRMTKLTVHALEKAPAMLRQGVVNITDAIYTYNFLFLGGPAPPAPYPSCGADPTADDLTCLEYYAFCE